MAAIKYFHKTYAGWELPTSHFMIAAPGKGIDRAHGMTPKKVPARLPLTWFILSQGQRVVTSMVDGGRVIWLGLARSYFLLCRASELRAYANGKVHPEFFLTRNASPSSEEKRRSRSRTDQARTQCSYGFWRPKTTRKGRGARLPEQERRARRKSGVGQPGLSKLCWSYSAYTPSCQGRPR